MPDRYPGYDVLAKRHTPSWNEVTRRGIDQRLALPRSPRFFTEHEYQTLAAVCDRIVPQPKTRPPVPLPAMVDDKMARNLTDGYRDARMPQMRAAWRCGLRALDAESRDRNGAPFHELSAGERHALLVLMEKGDLRNPAWGGMPSSLFFRERLAKDIISAYYTHPTAWNEIGFGGPASPRGYVRMGEDKRDPWEAAEAKPGHEDEALQKNRHVE